MVHLPRSPMGKETLGPISKLNMQAADFKLRGYRDGRVCGFWYGGGLLARF